MFPCFLKSLGAKNTVKIVFFDASQAQNHGIYGVFLLLVPKTTVFAVFCGRHLAKNSGIYAVFSMLQEVLFPCQKPKNTVNYSVLAFDTRWKTSENNQKCPKWRFSFPHLSTFKNEGSGASFFGALPRQAPASPSQNVAQIRASPPHTPQTSFASLRLYLYSAQAFGWLSQYS